MEPEKQTILDSILECIKREASEVGTVYVRKQDRIALGLEKTAVSQPVQHSAAPKPAPVRTFRRVVPADPVPASAPVCTPPPDVSAFTMEQLLAAVRQCQGCRLAGTRKNTVFADGDPHAKLMFIGEGPGEDEDLQGVPFVGRAGQLLTKMIAAMTLDRKQVYIANIVKCRPPGNRVPEETEAAVCLPYLHRQIVLVHPEIIVLLGSTPLKYLMGKTGITRLRGQWMDYQGIPVMPTYHPAYLLRNPSSKRDAWNDLQQVMSRMGLRRN